MIDDADGVEDGAQLRCGLCIVGGGAAGITLALQFLRGPTSVILLESGRRRPDPAVQALYEGEVADPALHPPTNRYRVRRFGGSTTLWGGRCMPLDPIDFARRPWMPHSGWPFGPEELASWYPQANRLCEAGAYDYSAATAVPGGMRPMVAGFAPEHFSTDGIERFSLPTDFGARYAHRLERSEAVRVLLGANATALVTGGDGTRVEGVRVRTLGASGAGQGFTVRADRVVLALGGLETPRLLLASRGGPGGHAHTEGVGNARGLVGRYYMCHMAGTSGRLRLAVPRERVQNGYEVADDGTYCRRRLHLLPTAQEGHGVGNAVMRLHFPSIPDPAHGSGVLSGLYLARRLLPYEYRKRLEAEGPQGIRDGVRHGLRHLRNLATDPFSATGFAWAMLRKRKLAARKFPSVIVRPPGNVYTLDFHAEQEPNPASRVTLAGDADPLGLPRIRVDWRHSGGDLRTAHVAFRLLADDLARWGGGRLDWSPERLTADLLREGAYGGHHIGTARMAASPAEGVVDPQGRVHGLHNLWVAGSAVFPTSGQANPTLTVVALALRLAAHLQAEASRPLAVRQAAMPAVPNGG